WTRSGVTADRAHLVLTFLIVGTALNGVLNMPYALQLANGWTRLTFWSNIIALVAMVPLMIVLTLRWGPAGAASLSIVLNATYVAVTVRLMHRRLLPTEQTRWYLHDVGAPMIVATLVVLIGRSIFPVTGGVVIRILCI